MVTRPSSVSDNWEYTGLRVTASSRYKTQVRGEQHGERWELSERAVPCTSPHYGHGIRTNAGKTHTRGFRWTALPQSKAPVWFNNVVHTLQLGLLNAIVLSRLIVITLASRLVFM